MSRYNIALKKAESGISADRIGFLLTAYLGFDVKELLQGTDAVIFGGAIRDIIANYPNSIKGLPSSIKGLPSPINEISHDAALYNKFTSGQGIEFNQVSFIRDIDIVALPKSAQTLEKFLYNRGFQRAQLSSIDMASMYLSNYPTSRIINEPWTYLKGNKKVQIIRPTTFHGLSELDTQQRVITQVDLSPCGVAFDGKKVFETVEGAFEDCLKKRFRVIEKNAMYQKNRITNRICKLQDRGWGQYQEKEMGAPLDDLEVLLNDLDEKVALQNDLAELHKVKPIFTATQRRRHINPSTTSNDNEGPF